MMTRTKTLLAILTCCTLACVSADAATVFNTAGSIYDAGNWDNGLPGTGNDGTIAISGASIPDMNNSGPLFDNGTYSITSSVDIATADEFNLRMAGTGGLLTWNMTDGTIAARFFLSNGGGGNVTFNMSGGQLVVDPGGNFIGAVNGGVFNISGSAELDASNAISDPNVDSSSTMNFLSGWTGSWTQGTFSGTDWRDAFVAGTFSFNGSTIDGATFDSNFQVTDAGQTLTLIPEPASGVMALVGLGAMAMRRRRG